MFLLVAVLGTGVELAIDVAPKGDLGPAVGALRPIDDVLHGLRLVVEDTLRLPMRGQVHRSDDDHGLRGAGLESDDHVPASHCASPHSMRPMASKYSDAPLRRDCLALLKAKLLEAGCVPRALELQTLRERFERAARPGRCMFHDTNVHPDCCLRRR